jgi:hypothetical protein
VPTAVGVDEDLWQRLRLGAKAPKAEQRRRTDGPVYSSIGHPHTNQLATWRWMEISHDCSLSHLLWEKTKENSFPLQVVRPPIHFELFTGWPKKSPRKNKRVFYPNRLRFCVPSIRREKRNNLFRFGSQTRLSKVVFALPSLSPRDSVWMVSSQVADAVSRQEGREWDVQLQHPTRTTTTRRRTPYKM